MAEATDREKLKYELAASRQAIAAYTGALRCDLDLRAKLKRGVRRNPLAWYAGAGVLGLLLSRIPARRHKTVIKGPKRSNATKEAGRAAFALTVLKFGLDIAKPALLRWFTSRYLGRAPSRKSN